MADFDDSKDEGALRTIGEVAGATGIKTHVLRYWEQQFPQLQPLKRSGGRRYYRPDDIALVEKIDDLVNQQGYTLKGAKAALKEARGGTSPESGEVGAAEASAKAPSQADMSNETIGKLKAIRDDLQHALADA